MPNVLDLILALEARIDALDKQGKKLKKRVDKYHGEEKDDDDGKVDDE